MSYKVLLVDDDVDLIEQYTPVLEQAGYTVKGAYDSKEGLESFQDFNPDVVFVDLAMEQFDSGFVLCQKLKKHPKGSETPVIIMTSAGHETGIRFSTDTAEEKKWIRADDYLEKPVAPRDLVQYLNEKLFK